MEYLKRKRQKTSLLQQIEQERAAYEQTIKSEPSEKGSPLHAGTSPVRFNPHEQMSQDPYNQQWIPDLNAGEPVMNYNYVPDMQWPGPSYQMPMQVQSNVTPTMQARSPMHMTNLPVTSPNIHAISPQVQVMSPQCQVMSPQGQVMSPHGQVMSPQGLMHDMSRQGHAMQSVSPGLQMMPQGQVMSPQGQMMSPQGQVMSPQGQMMSPQGQVMSPQGHMMSPHLTVDPERCGVSPGMHMSNMGHVSPVMPQQQPMVQPMEQNSVSSIANFLLDRGAVNFNSGEIAAILDEVSDRPNDLSDSLNRLSTSDLLHP